MKAAIPAAIAILAIGPSVFAQRHRAVVAAGPRVEVEAARIDFGSATGDVKELPAAITVRVFSPYAWSLRLLPVSSFADNERGQAIDWQRVECRAGSLPYRPLLPQGVTVARGGPTRAGGVVVSVDLRLAFAGDDPLGRFAGSLQVALDSW